MNKLSRVLVIAAVVFPFVSQSAVAETASNQTLIVTATRTTQTADESLAAVSVITRRDIDRSQAKDMVELLRGEAGIDITRTGGPGQQTSLFMRGTNSNHVLVLIDGVRVASATTGAFAWQTLDLTQIERVEIVRGPRASLYGSDAIGGVIQIFTRKPAGVTARMEVGSFDTRAVEATFASEGATRFYATPSVRRARGFSATNDRAGPFFDPDKDGYETRALNIGMVSNLNPTATLELGAWNSGQDVAFDPGQDRSETENRAVSARLRQQLDRDWVHTLNLGSALDDAKNYGSFPSRVTTWRDSLDWQHDLSLSEHHLLTVGVSYWEDQGKNLDTSSNTTIFDQRVNDRALFAQWQGRFGEHDVQLAARGDRHSAFGNHRTGQLAWGWNMTAQWRVLASYGTAFRAPTLNELYSPGFNIPPFGVLSAGNPNLNPERSRSTEIGAQYAVSANEKWRLNLYQTRVTDLIAFQGTNSQAINVNEARLSGAELEYRLRRDPWQVTANATYQKAINEVTNTDLLRRPRRKLSSRIDYNFDHAGFIGGELIAASDHADIDNVTFATNRVGGYGLVNVYAGYRVAPEWSLEMRVENLLNKDYELVSGYNTTPFAVFLGLRYTPVK